MHIGEACQRDPVTASADDSVRDAAKRMKQLGVGSLIVIDEGRHPIGVVTDRDVVQRVIRRRRDPDTTTLGEIMSVDIVSVWDRAPLERAFHRMRQNDARRVITTDDHGRVSGLITADDALRIISSDLAAIADVIGAQSPDAAAEPA